MRVKLLIIGILLSAPAFAFTVTHKTEFKNGLRTTLCIGTVCKTFEDALFANAADFHQQPLIIKIQYPGGEVREFNWTEDRYIDEAKDAAIDESKDAATDEPKDEDKSPEQ